MLEALIDEKISTQALINILNTLLLWVKHDKLINIVTEERLQKVMSYIHSSIHLNLSNIELAKIINVDARHFIRLFKKYYLQTPQEYISNYRLYQASKYLLQGLSATETAEKVGFKDVKAFYRYFKVNKGVTPSEFIKSYSLQP